MNSILCATIVSVLISSVSCDEGHKRLLLHDDASLSQAYQTLAAEVTALKSTVANLQSSSGTGGGSVYVRWGRTSCPANGTDLIYAGFCNGPPSRVFTICFKEEKNNRKNMAARGHGHAAGFYFDSTGGATNHLCLTTDPQWAHYEDAVNSGGRIYGVEYQFGEFHSNGGSAFFGGKNVHNEDAPCAVCQSPRPKMLMIPGRLECYAGWTKEYNGYLVSDYKDHNSPSEYICLDSSPGVIFGGHNNQNGRLLYLVEGVCGSLKCPPYVQGRELTCVVCTK